MGAWGHRSFDNDDASDWLSDLTEVDDFSLLEAALATVVGNAGGYLEASDCSTALAAAEMIAALNGKPSSAIPEEGVSWLKGKPRPNSALLEAARQAVSLVSASSELQELWAESEDADRWQTELGQLQSRLA